MDQIFVQAAKYGSPGKMKSHIHLDGEKGLSNILPLFFYAVIINRYYGSMSMCSWEETSLLEHLSLFSDLICVHNEAGTYTAISELTVWGKAIGKGVKAFWFRLSRGIQIRKRWVLFFHIFGLCSSHSGVLQRNRLRIHCKSMPQVPAAQWVWALQKSSEQLHSWSQCHPSELTASGILGELISGECLRTGRIKMSQWRCYHIFEGWYRGIDSKNQTKPKSHSKNNPTPSSSYN